MKSSSAGSAHWRSSKTRSTGAQSATRSKNRRQAAKSSSRSNATCEPGSSRVASRGSIQRRSVSSGTNSTRVRSSCRRATSLSVPSLIRARRRTISASGANVMPSPYDGARPTWSARLSGRASRWRSNSQTRRLLPMPAMPSTDTDPAPPSGHGARVAGRSSSASSPCAADERVRRGRPPGPSDARRPGRRRATWRPVGSCP